MSKVIDVHWHHIPKAFAEAVVAGNVPVAGRVVTDDEGLSTVLLDSGFKQTLPASLTDPATILADMDSAGVDVVAASIATPMSHLDVAPEIGLAVSRAVNDAFAELADDYHGRVLPLGNGPLQDVDLAIGELRRITDEYGFKGVQVGSNIGGKNLGDESHFPFWEKVRERDLFVFSHGVNPLGADRLKDH